MNNEEKKVQTRRLSLEDDFMTYKTDDLLFGALFYLATMHPTEKRLYLSLKSFTKVKKDIYNLCELNCRTLKAHLDKLKKQNLLQEEKIKIGGEETPVYTFPCDYNGGFQMVEREMLWYVVSTRNAQAVRVYVYLLNKYKWKPDYIFTIKDILKAIGYSEDNKVASGVINNILESFQREGVVKFEEFYEEKCLDDGSVVPVPKKRLVFVASSKADLKA